jgi:hypothetical protein
MYVTANAAMGATKSDFAVDKTTDPMRVVLMPSPLLADNEVHVYVGGHAVRLQINDEIAAREYKNMGAEHLNGILAASRDVNNWLSKAYTGYSPDFIFTNPIRDAIQGSIVLTGRYGAGVTASIYKNYPKAVKELYKNLKNKGSSQLVNDYRANGGQIGAAYMSDLDRIGDDIQASFEEYQGAKVTYKNTYDKAVAEGKSAGAAHIKASFRSSIAGFKKVPIAGHFLKLMESINSIAENALRLATYDTLKNEYNESALKSAAAAKELMNFNRKGEQQAMSALWLFYNPSVQGTKLVYESLFESPYKNQARVLTGMMALGAIAMAGLAAAGGDDDEWDKLQDNVKDGNIVFFINGTAYTIPLPYGFKAFWTLGNVVSDAQKGEDIDKLSIRLASSVFENFSPIGNPIKEDAGRMEFNPFQNLPTSAKMALGPSENQDGFGNPITPRRWNNATPDSQLMNRGTHGSFYDAVASSLNDATGGSQYERGYVDVSPETLKYWVKSLTGGTGQFVFDSVGIASGATQGVLPQDTKDVPVLRRFARNNSVSDARSKFYDIKAEADIAMGELTAARKNRDGAAVQELSNQNGEMIKLARLGNRLVKMANAKRDAIVSIRNDKNLTLKEKQLKMRELEIAEEAIYNRYINMYKDSKDGGKRQSNG